VDEHSDDDDDEDSTYAGFAHPHHEPNNNLEDIYTTSIMQDLDDLQQLQFLHESAATIRSDRWEHNRLNWDAHVRQLQHEGLFENEYLMTVPTHGKLVRILDPILQRAEYNSRCHEPILVEHIIAIGLRGLQGGRPKDLRHVVRTCRTAAYDALNDFIDAVNMAPELAINMPETPEQWDAICEGYKRKSTNEIMAGCVGCLDGFFQRTNKPTKQETRNVLSYYSGHYESYGLNCQACVQSDLQFMYFEVVSPGSTNDNISYPQSASLKSAFESLPRGYFGLADAAYPLCENLLVPFTGADRLDPALDAFNYYLSQLRIRVEMAFGRLVNKFRILSGKIVGSMERVSAILTACARLHNFIIQNDGPFEAVYSSVEEEMESLSITPNPSAPLGMSYLPVVPNEEFVPYSGISYTREAIVEHIREYDIRRPKHNIERQKQERQERLDSFVSPNGMVIEREYVTPN